MPERTPEEARAIEERIEREVGEIVQAHFAHIVGHGYTHFSKVLGAKLIGRMADRMLEEDHEYAMIFSEQDRATLDKMTKQFEDHVMRWYHAQMSKTRD